MAGFAEAVTGWCFNHRYIIASIVIMAILLYARIVAWSGPGGGFTSRPPTFW